MIFHEDIGFIESQASEESENKSFKQDKKIRNLISFMALIILFGMLIVLICFIRGTMQPPIEKSSPNIWDVPLMDNQKLYKMFQRNHDQHQKIE